MCQQGFRSPEAQLALHQLHQLSQHIEQSVKQWHDAVLSYEMEGMDEPFTHAEQLARQLSQQLENIKKNVAEVHPSAQQITITSFSEDRHG